MVAFFSLSAAGGAGTEQGLDPVPPGAVEIFRGDYSTGDFTQWDTVQKAGYNGSAAAFTPDAGLSIVNDGDGHETAARFTVADGDIPPFGGGERCEVRAGEAADVTEGAERWYRFDLKFASDYPATTGDWHIVMQWHAGIGSPPLCLEVNPDDTLRIQSNAAGQLWSLPIGDIARGVWVDYVLHVKFSNDPEVGFVEVWRAGTKVIDKTFKPTMSSAGNYLKMGIYRDPAETTTAVVHQDGLVVYQV